MHASQVTMMKQATTEATESSSDDWDTDPDFVNTASEKEARRENPHVVAGEKEVLDLRHTKQAVVQTHEAAVKHEYAGSSFSRGYGMKGSK